MQKHRSSIQQHLCAVSLLNRLTVKSTKMELKDQIIQKYLNTGCGYRKLQARYGISRVSRILFTIQSGTHILTGLPHCKTISLQNTAGKLTCSKIFTVQKTDSKSKLCFKVTGNIRAGNLLTGKLINEQA